MENRYTVENLQASFWNNSDDTYDLEFIGGWIKGVPARLHPNAAVDEYYWDEQKHIDAAKNDGEVIDTITLKINGYPTKYEDVDDAISKVDQIAYEKSVDYYDDRIQRIFKMEKHFNQYDDEDTYNRDKEILKDALIQEGKGLEILQKYIAEFELSRIEAY
ncbi:hypothetical protein NHG25_08610 [Aerococcaceae bacterium NML191292]|nr:hypothetical protein [Aerococcaceae bacterium NML191292]